MLKLPAPTCLITALVRELSARQLSNQRSSGGALKTPPVVVLPTRRLGTALIAALAKDSPRQGIVAPVTMTLEEMIRKGVDHLDSPEAAAILKLSIWPADRIELLIESILRHETFKFLHPGHAHELAHFFGELEKNSLERSAFKDLHRIVAEDIYRAEESLGMIAARLKDIEAVYKKLTMLMDNAAGTSSQLWNQRAANLLARTWKSTSLLPWTDVMVAGFTSASPAEMSLLKTLAEIGDSSVTATPPHQTVSLFLHDSPPVYAKTTPLKDLLLQLGAVSAPPSPPSTTSGAPGKTRLIVRLPGIADEVAWAADLASQALAAGIPASQIAIIATDEGTYGNPLRSVLLNGELDSQSAGRCNIAVPVALADTTEGSWLRLLTLILSQEADAETVLDFVAHPHSMNDFDRARLSDIICRERILTTEDLRRFCARNKVPELSAQLIAIKDFFGRLDTFTSAHQERRPASAEIWCKRLNDLANEFLGSAEPLTATSGMDTQPAPLSSNLGSALQSFVTNLQSIESVYPHALSGEEFLKAADRYLLGVKVRDVGDPLAGIQVLGLTEARHMPFALTIILGCTEGNFPRSVPRDALIDQYLQARINLPGWRQLEAMEDTTFGLLHERLPTIVMTYPGHQGDSPTVRSRFLDRLVNEGQAQVLTADGRSCFLGKLSPPSNSKNTAPPEFTGIDANAGDIQSTSSISATSLTRLLECPYAFVLKKLGVTDQSFHRDDDRRAEGEWLHEVLEAFFTGYSGRGSGRRRLAAELPATVSHDDFEGWATARLIEIAEKVAPQAIQETALWLRLRSHSFPAFAAHVKKIWTRGNQIVPARGWKELRLRTSSEAAESSAIQPEIFAMVKPPTEESAGIPASGSIDTIDFCESVTLITDYKRSGTPAGTDVERGYAPQLPFYIHALQNAAEPADFAASMPLEGIIAGYWSILDGEFVLAGTGSDRAFREAKNLGLISPHSRSPRDLGSSISAFRRNWRWRLDEIQSKGAYLPDESACGYCQLATSCRKADPHLRTLFKDNRRLELYKTNAAPQSSQAPAGSAPSSAEVPTPEGGAD